ncbi:Hypothetical protein CINCED_3A000509 [Cinara cedri]|uniref:Uncharacterized protein n=1 Tax=Cinara cedri TaxID=506608 RepID=A0A5E4M910_9HEMI|nr:Hypothetical protein CINCED_3A000509 [Cinara cedri]
MDSLDTKLLPVKDMSARAYWKQIREVILSAFTTAGFELQSTSGISLYHEHKNKKTVPLANTNSALNFGIKRSFDVGNAFAVKSYGKANISLENNAFILKTVPFAVTNSALNFVSQNSIVTIAIFNKTKTDPEKIKEEKALERIKNWMTGTNFAPSSQKQPQRKPIDEKESLERIQKWMADAELLKHGQQSSNNVVNESQTETSHSNKITGADKLASWMFKEDVEIIDQPTNYYNRDPNVPEPPKPFSIINDDGEMVTFRPPPLPAFTDSFGRCYSRKQQTTIQKNMSRNNSNLYFCNDNLSNFPTDSISSFKKLGSLNKKMNDIPGANFSRTNSRRFLKSQTANLSRKHSRTLTTPTSSTNVNFSQINSRYPTSPTSLTSGKFKRLYSQTSSISDYSYTDGNFFFNYLSFI